MSRSHRPKLTDAEQFARVLGATNVTSVGNYTLGKTLGEGTFGKVKMGTHKLTGQEVAIKIVDKIHAPSVVREIETWRYLHHPNIAQLYEVLTTESKIYMVTELCNGGEAFDYICEHGRMDDRSTETIRIFRQVVEAVGYCHQKNFVHRDLKLENVLLTEDLQVKVIDFGFTREYNDKKLLDTYCGSSAYAAPEMITGKKYSGPGADIWSLGVILYTIICGFLPFDDENDVVVHRKIAELDYELPEFLSPVSCDLISKILVLDPAERLSIPNILSHPWFRDDENPEHEPPPTTLPAPLGSTLEEAALVSHLEVIGMDVSNILASVHANACDQASALWYLLLSKHRTTSPNSPSLNSLLSTPISSTATSPTLVAPSPSSVPPSESIAAVSTTSLQPRQITMEQYLANARRRKSMPGDVGSFSSSISPTTTNTNTRGGGGGGTGPAPLRGESARNVLSPGGSPTTGTPPVNGNILTVNNAIQNGVMPAGPGIIVSGVNGGRRNLMIEAMRSANGGGGADGTRSGTNSPGSSSPTLNIIPGNSNANGGSGGGSPRSAKFGRRANLGEVGSPMRSHTIGGSSAASKKKNSSSDSPTSILSRRASAVASSSASTGDIGNSNSSPRNSLPARDDAVVGIVINNGSGESASGGGGGSGGGLSATFMLQQQQQLSNSLAPPLSAMKQFRSGTLSHQASRSILEEEEEESDVPVGRMRHVSASVVPSKK